MDHGCEMTITVQMSEYHMIFVKYKRLVVTPEHWFLAHASLF